MHKYNKLKNRNYIQSKVGYIGKIVKQDKPFIKSTKCINIKEMFDKTDSTGACIIDENNYPIGLIMKNSLNLYDNAIFTNQTVTSVMDKKPLIVDYYTDITEVSNAAMCRNTENAYDYIIVTKNQKYYGVVTIRSLLHYTTMLQSNDWNGKV